MNNKLRPQSLAKFWQNAKKTTFALSLFMTVMFLVTNPVIKSSGLYHKAVSAWHTLLQFNDVFMFIGLVSVVTFVLLVATKRVKPKHDELIWDIAARDLKCESGYYDEEFLYLKTPSTVTSYAVQSYVDQINSLSQDFKYDLIDIQQSPRIITIRPLQISNSKRLNMKKKIQSKSVQDDNRNFA